MAKLSNSPKQALNFELERRKSFTFRVRLKYSDSSPVNLTGCTLRFVMKSAGAVDDHFDLNNLVVNSEATIGAPLTGEGVFAFQAAELDGDPGEYGYSIVLWSPDNFSTVLAKGFINLLDNSESHSMHRFYSATAPTSALELTMRGGDVVEVEVVSLPQVPVPIDTISWPDVLDKPERFPPSAHGHPINEVTGLAAELAGKQPAGNYAASVHQHTVSDVNGLQAALDGKQPTGSYASSSHTHPAANITDLAEATQDVVGAMIVDAGGTYDDAAGTITLPSGGGAVSSVAGRTGDVVLSSADLTDGASLATDAELAAGLAGKAGTAHTHSAADITSGTFAAARLPAASTTASGVVELATTAEATAGTDTTRAVTPAGVAAAIAGVGGGVNDHGTLSGLTDDDHTQYALADGSRGAFAPTTHDHTASQISDSTETGRSLITAANAAAVRTAIGAGTSNLAIGTTGTTAAAGNRQATATATGMVELATTAEATAGTDTVRAVTPAGLKAVADTKASASHTHSISDVTGLQAALDAEADRVYNVDGNNLVANGSFEIGSSDDPAKCVGWSGFGSHITRSASAARSGLMGMHLVPHTATLTSYYQPYLPSETGRVYRIRYWVKLLAGSDDSQMAGVIAVAQGPARTTVRAYYPPDYPTVNGVVGEWRQVERVVRLTDPDVSWVRFGIWARASTNELAFDDVMVEDITEAELVKQSAMRDAGVTSVSDFGADPTGVSSSESAFRNAIAATPAGGTLRVPRGHYKRTYTAPTGEGSYIVIDKPINIVGEPGAVMENFLLYFKGAFDSPLGLANAEEGDRTISTSAPHGWKVGDYVQVMSQYNVYSSAAGPYQLGSINPTNGTTPTVRTGEIHRVGKVPSTTSLGLDRTLVFGGYRSGSQVRRIRTLDGVTLQGIRFVNTENANYLGIVARGCSNLVIRDCDFVSGSNAGKSVQIYDSIGTRIIGGSIIKYTDSFSGSSWNTIIIGGGCTDTIIEGVYAEGGAQTIDFTNLLGGGSALGEDGGRTAQGMEVRNCTFRNCGDAFTTHPGTMGFFAHGNDIYGGSTGIRVRSRRSVIRNNKIHTARAGIALSGFVNDSVVSDNDLVHLPSSAFPGYYYGVHYTSISSEIDNGNRLLYAQIKGNVIVVKDGVNASSRAITFSYSNLASYPVSDEYKKNNPLITVEGNTLYGGGIQVSDAINACRIVNNTFQGGNDYTHRIVCLSTANVIMGNTFLDSGPHIKLGPVPVGGTYPYNTVNRVGGNNYQFPINNELVNHTPTFTEA